MRWEAKELLETDFPELDWLVPGIIPEGFTLLGGRPKVGKSWLSMQIAMAVGSGGKVFERRVEQGKVLYLALEDGPRRLARRMKMQRWQDVDCVFYTEWEPLNQGGLERLETEFTAYAYRLCVLDTTSRGFRLKDHNDVSAVTSAYAAVQKLSERTRVSILAIDHYKKGFGEDNDPIESMMSSTGKVAVADTAIGIARQRGKKEARIKVVGREAEEVEAEIMFDSISMCWQWIDPHYVKPGSKQEFIVEYLFQRNEFVTLTELGTQLNMNKGNLYAELVELVGKGLVEEKKVSNQNYYRAIVAM